MKKVTRARLSIDLDAWPDVRDMLADAAEATQQSPTKITIMALRNQLPAVVKQLRDEIHGGTDRFLKKHAKATLSTASAASPAAFPGEAGAASALKAIVPRRHEHKPAPAEPLVTPKKRD